MWKSASWPLHGPYQTIRARGVVLGRGKLHATELLPLARIAGVGGLTNTSLIADLPPFLHVMMELLERHILSSIRRPARGAITVGLRTRKITGSGGLNRMYINSVLFNLK